MGKQGNMKFIGTVENTIYYQWKDIYVVRTKPTTVQQTAATIQQSKLFGTAAHTGARLRRLLKPVLPNAVDKHMMRRFEQAIVQWLRTGAVNNNQQQTNLPFITGFEFNEQSALQTRLKTAVTVYVNMATTITVNIPALQPVPAIIAPGNTTAVIFTVSAATCDLLDEEIAGTATKQLTMPYNNEWLPAQQVDLPLGVDAGTVTIVLLALQYVVKGNVSINVKWLPAGVVGSAWGG